MLPYFKGVGPEYIDNDYMLRLNKAILDSFKPKAKNAFFTICSWAKPYSTGYIHHGIRRALYDADLLDKVDYIHISSAGIVPAEAELWATLYDWNNEEVQDDITFTLLRNRIKERLVAFLTKFGKDYDNIFFYIRDTGNTKRAVDSALEDMPEIKGKCHFVYPTLGDAYSKEQQQKALDYMAAYQIRKDPDDILVCNETLGFAISKMRRILSNG